MKVSILGGDERSIRLAYLLEEDGHKVKAFGFKEDKIKKSILSNTLEKALEEASIIIGPIPLTHDGIHLNTPLDSDKIPLEKIFKKMEPKQVFMAGKIPDVIYNMAKSYDMKVVDLMDREEMSVLNGIPTAEGAIQVTMEEMDIVLHGANALVLGFGRMGKILSKKLQGLDVNVYVAARKTEDLAWIESCGYIPVNIRDLKDYIRNMDVIFNTIPSLILDEEMLLMVGKNTLIIDIASAPGGVDFQKAEEFNIKAIWALGLPGKVAPKTAAIVLKNTITNIIEELGVI